MSDTKVEDEKRHLLRTLRRNKYGEVMSLQQRSKEDLSVLLELFTRQVQIVSEDLVRLLQERHELREQIAMRKIAVEQLLRFQSPGDATDDDQRLHVQSPDGDDDDDNDDEQLHSPGVNDAVEEQQLTSSELSGAMIMLMMRTKDDNDDALAADADYLTVHEKRPSEEAPS